jgi:CubicO group peptidase (beta-lactamase class C family)
MTPEVAAPLQRLAAALQSGIAAGRLPGAVVAVQGRGWRWVQALGERAAPGVPAPAGLAAWAPLDAAAVYDCASLTKIVVTAPLMAGLLHARAVALDDPVGRFLPVAPEGAAVTLRQLLTHSSGHAASLSLQVAWSGQAEGRRRALAQGPIDLPGQGFRYSDINFLLLEAVVETVGAMPFEQQARERLFEPMGLRDTGFHAHRWALPSRLVPTEIDARDGLLLGRVHDPTCRRMGGAAGHAGLFSTVGDLLRFVTLIVQEGAIDGRQVLPAAAVAAMLTDASPPGLVQRRTAGWDLDSPYSRARGAHYTRGRSAGHTGFTGCALWLEPGLGGGHVLLSNRVHPTARESIVDLYETVGTEAALALRAASAQR